MAVPTPAPRSPSDSGGMIPATWPAQAADTIVDVVDRVRDKTTKPALKAARAVVYGPIIAIVTPILLILAVALLVRLWSILLDDRWIWTLYGGLGLVCIVGGLVLLRKAKRPAAAA